MRESELTQILRGAERPRALTESERARLSGRLEAKFGGSVARSAPDQALLAPTAGSDDVVPARRWPAILVVAAVVLLVVAGLVIGGRSVRDTTNPATPVSEVTLPVPCTAEIDDAGTGLQRWLTTENWAFASDAEPDLAALVGEALRSLEVYDSVAAEAVMIRTELENEIAAVDDGVLPLLNDEARGRQAAVDGALSGLRDLIAASALTGCEL